MAAAGSTERPDLLGPAHKATLAAAQHTSAGSDSPMTEKQMKKMFLTLA